MTAKNLDIQIMPIIDEEQKTFQFNFVIQIDGNPINESHCVDLYEIMTFSTQQERDYVYFWSCDCGIPDCARIEHTLVKEKRNSEELFLLIPVPCSTNDFDEESRYDYWQKNHKRITLKTSRKEIAKKLWDLSFHIEEVLKAYSKKYRILSWPASSNSSEYEWPENLPVNIRMSILEKGYNF